jgi:hypothetical protein
VNKWDKWSPAMGRAPSLPNPSSRRANFPKTGHPLKLLMHIHIGKLSTFQATTITTTSI